MIRPGGRPSRALRAGYRSGHDLAGAKIQVQEAISSLQAYADRLEPDPERLQYVEQRIGEFNQLARKYHCRPEELPPLLATLQQELEGLTADDDRLALLTAETEEAETAYLKSAGRLSKGRKAAASRLSKQVSSGIETLNMANGRFQVELVQLELQHASELGLDRVEYQVSANPGQPLKPLAKVASGGELSRISLAIQVATANVSRIPTLIFDEVDVGIGGGTAEVVGKLLRQIGDQQQVLCVTHLPQVASQAHHQIMVAKQQEAGGTTTRLTRLEATERVEEIARMLGGVELTETSMEHAREMLATG